MYIANTIQLLSGIASDLLEGAIAEGADETGVLVLVQSHARRGEPYCGSIEAPIRHAVVGERPSQDWGWSKRAFWYCGSISAEKAIRNIG